MFMRAEPEINKAPWGPTWVSRLAGRSWTGEGKACRGEVMSVDEAGHLRKCGKLEKWFPSGYIFLLKLFAKACFVKLVTSVVLAI